MGIVIAKRGQGDLFQRKIIHPDPFRSEESNFHGVRLWPGRNLRHYKNRFVWKTKGCPAAIYQPGTHFTKFFSCFLMPLLSSPARHAASQPREKAPIDPASAPTCVSNRLATR